MADVVTTTDIRVFVRVQPGKSASCPPADAAVSIRSLLAEDDASIPHDDTVTLERAAEALEDLAGVPHPQVAAPAAANGHAAGAAAAEGGAPAVKEEPVKGEQEEQAQQQNGAKSEKKKKEKKREEEPAAAASDGKEKKKKKKQKVAE